MYQAGNKCDYINCGKSKRTNPGLHMFSFPIKDAERCSQWILNSGGKTTVLDMSPTKLKSRKICEDHFESASFLNQLKQRLVHNAVPVSCENVYAATSHETLPSTAAIKELEQTLGKPALPTTLVEREPLFLRRSDKMKTYRRLFTLPTPTGGLFPPNTIEDIAPLSPTLKFILNSSSYDKLEIPKSPTIKVGLKKNVKIKCKKNEKIKSQRSEIIRLRRKIKRMTVQNKTKNASTFLKMQLEHKSRQRWDPDMIDLAMNIYYTSTTAYKKLRREGIILPGISTLQSYLNKITILPGFTEEVFHRLAVKVKNWSTQQRLCILMFDEIAIKRNLDYHKKYDMIEGFQDLGQLGRTDSYASEALVFMASGLCAKWKIPIAYFLSSGTTLANNQKQLLVNCIQKLQTCGLIVKAVVCDQGPNNRSTVSQLNISPENPILEIANEKMYFFYDVPHLIKSIRNQLITRNFIYNNKSVSWEAVTQTYNLDQISETARSLPRLSNVHIHPNNFQKMRCKLAFQVFSDSMAAAIRTAIVTGQLPPNYGTTADFIKFINDLFDSLNSSTLYAKNKNRSALSEKNPHIRVIMCDGLKIMKMLKTSAGTVPPCFSGLLQSITACLKLYEDLRSNYGIEYLLTRRLTQDALENLFAIFRQKGGSNDNPTARSFRLSFRHLFCANLKKNCTTSNCEEDEHQFIFNSYVTSSMNSSDSNNEATDMKKLPITFPSADNVTSVRKRVRSKVTLEDCAVRYTAGYVLRKCLIKFKCSVCQVQLKTSTTVELNTQLIKQKTYINGNLCIPNNTIFEVVQCVLKIFSNLYPTIKYKERLVDNLYNVAENEVKNQFPEFLNSPDCDLHRKFIIRQTIITRILKQVTWESNCIRKWKTVKMNSKIRKVSHV